MGGKDLLDLSSPLRPGPVLQEAKATPTFLLCVSLSISKALDEQMSKDVMRSRCPAASSPGQQWAGVRMDELRFGHDSRGR